MIAIEVQLSDWFYNSLLGNEVLTISEDYFRLRKPLERRIYELCRKHCGNQKKWEIGLELLRKKTGSGSSKKEFSRIVHKIINSDHIPDYRIYFDKEIKDKLIVHPRVSPTLVIDQNRPILKPQTIDNAKKILGRHFDVYMIEANWLSFWETSGRPKFESPDGAFIGYCKTQCKDRKI